MMGFGLPDGNLRAPNEKFHIPNFYRGIESICLFFEKLEDSRRSSSLRAGARACWPMDRCAASQFGTGLPEV